MQTENLRKTLGAGLLMVISLPGVAQNLPRANLSSAIPTNTLLRIIRAEDERRWDADVAFLLADKNAKIRVRATLAAGRIGDERAVPALVDLLRGQNEPDVRQMAAFALGEIESTLGAKVLIALLDDTHEQPIVRARAVEALGKIGEAMIRNPPSPEAQKAPWAEGAGLAEIRKAILDALKFEEGRRSAPDRLTILLGLTAALRAKPDGAGPVIVHFLNYSDPRIVADGLNTMARLRLNDGADQVRQLLNNGDILVRANAARVLGATEDKQSFDALLARALNDYDLRVRVSAIRALGSLKDARAAEPLLKRGSQLLGMLRTNRQTIGTNPTVQNELLEVVAALGRLAPPIGSGPLLRDERSTRAFFLNVRELIYPWPAEVEIAFARIAPRDYIEETVRAPMPSTDWVTQWKQVSSVAQGLGEIANAKTESATGDSKQLQRSATQFLGSLLCKETEGVIRVCVQAPTLALPEIMQAYAAFKPPDLFPMIELHLSSSDVVVRATSAELLGKLPADARIEHSLIKALPRALEDKDLNDAALSILDALAKQKNKEANDAIKTALDSSDHLIRQRAVALLKANGVGDFSNRIGTVKTRNTEADYRRAIARIGRHVTATVVTSKGSFTVEFLTEEAPLNVDNFIQLAHKGFFNGQTIPRVVPNFVIQAGDPRGDQNGGPGYQIRCEINEVPYERAAVGMALSGKDTGGSQWFVTHSPQPHLDGGYTVFGRVIRGMDVVDNIARGDKILRVIVNER